MKIVAGEEKQTTKFWRKWSGKGGQLWPNPLWPYRLWPIRCVCGFMCCFHGVCGFMPGPSVGTPSAGPPTISLFSTLPPEFSFFLSSLGGLLVELWARYKAEFQNKHRKSLCEPPGQKRSLGGLRPVRKRAKMGRGTVHVKPPPTR